MRKMILMWASSLVACGGAQGTEPEDMSASEHRQAAAEHHHEGDVAGTRVVHPGSVRGGGATDVVVDRGAAHHEEAGEHAAAANELDARLASACEGVPEPQQHACPLAGGGQLTEVEGGVEITLPASAGSAEEVQRLARCHMARMGVEGLDHAPACPLAVASATATATAAPNGEVRLRIVAQGEEAAAEVRRRAESMPGLQAAMQRHRGGRPHH